MHHDTVKYLDNLKEYVDEHYEKWLDQYHAVVGISISNKHRGGKKKRYYSIVFHVIEKNRDLSEDQKIPPSFPVDIQGRGSVRVPTDVVETGEFELTGVKSSIYPGCAVHNTIADEWGTLGPVVVDKESGEYFVLGNMHVLGKHHLDNNIYCTSAKAVDRKFPLELKTLTGESVSAYFVKGSFEGPYDLAIARIREESISRLSIEIPGIGKQSGFMNVNSSKYLGWNVITIDSKFRLKPTIITSQSTSCRFTLNGEKVTITDLIQLRPKCCEKGDSGAPVFDESGAVFGIIVGMDYRFSYAVKIKHAYNLFGVSVAYR